MTELPVIAVSKFAPLQIGNSPMRWTICFCIVALAAEASAQDDTTLLPKTPVRFVSILMQPDGSLRLDIQDWIPETKEVTYQVQVPVTKEVEVNGEKRTITETVLEIRTRTVTVLRPMASASTLPEGGFLLYQMGGAKLSSIPPKRQAAILLEPGQKLDTWYRSIVRSDTVVVAVKPGINAVPLK